MTATLTPPPVAVPPRQRTGRALVVLFTLTAFTGAALLFTVQPLVARLLLPMYGGSATVWSTCSLFFQVLLLVGYVYSHLTTSRLPRRRQPLVHLAVLALPLATLPLALPAAAAPAADGSPTLWLLRTLALMIGLPFVVLSTTGPLLQRWYSWADGPRSDDPYFLFAASNVGSFGGLLAYPFLVEPYLSLGQQTTLFSWAFVGFAVLTATCGLLGTRSTEGPHDAAPVTPTRLPRRRLARWCWYAFVPSCLFLAVTHHLSTDVAPIPLLWVVPLGLYLATFVAAFAVTSRRVPPTLLRLTAGLALCATMFAPLATRIPLSVVIGLDLALVVVVGYTAHRLLAADRPEPEHLTTFYIAVAVGGALGGVVNGLIAPVLFDRVLEYQLIVALLPALALGVAVRRSPRGYRPTAIPDAARFVVGLALIAGATAALVLASRGGSTAMTVVGLVVFAGLGWVLAVIPRALVATLVAATVGITVMSSSSVVHRDRTFYGSYAVSSSDGVTQLTHGTTIHGRQVDATPGTPTTYYGLEAPLGDVMADVRPQRTVAVGLGVGTIAAYGRPGDSMTFLEIDPAIAEIAADPQLFTFLSDSRAEVDVAIGDGRLLAKDLPDGRADLVVLDAFSSDAIPVHLLTREAFRTYAQKVSDGGAIAVHVSNRHFDLVPVVAAATADLGWHGAVGRGGPGTWVTPSAWVLISPDASLVERVGAGERWSPLDLDRTVPWTDDYSSVLTVLR
ncbi:fused MFS/spermidine synthase [Nocardioides coralli]|uniref:fused MFS/spermidine synthase n=1 Tax=Nocardioides coralli TaxID=2872154 RepID=UPI001CA39C27|nr:fused MFS/spermidine synthase [Nocardioides coralli]QZY27999.1 fused MFS/spermidine synthase [Nocardioides coralli]